MSRIVRSAAVAIAIALCGGFACGGGDTGGTSPLPGPGPGPAPPAANPCAAVADGAPTFEPSATRSSKRAGVYGDTRWSWLDHAWTHRTVATRLAAEPPGGAGALDRDVGEIAVLEDTGRIVLPANQFDLRGRGLRFRPNGSAGYDVASADSAFRAPLGSRLTLEDDDSSAVAVPFGFPLYGRAETAAFVNSDGNVTFGEGDSASTARNVTRLLSGPPRIAIFFADLDPSAGGSMWVNAAPDAFTVTWCAVRGFESQRIVTAQATLLPDGIVEVRVDDATTLPDAIVGLSPGQTTEFSPVDLSVGAQGSGPGAIGERFTQNAELDLVGASRRFYATHGDGFDQLVFWTDTRVVTDAFAFETTIANDIRGLGINLFDQSRDYGSDRLSSLVVMDALTKYPDDPRRRFLGENNTVSVLGQETGHRWLVFFRFRDVNRQTSEALLGRDDAHWSFFVDSDASVMEGNDIEDLGGGSFRTVGAVSRYSRADMYAMGLVGESDVPPFFYVENPVNPRPSVSGPDDAPQIGVTFNGTKRQVRLQDIIDVVGRRQPGVTSAPKTWRQAFIYVVGGGGAVDQGQVAKVDRIRRAWEEFYSGAVGGRGRVDTRLR